MADLLRESDPGADHLLRYLRPVLRVASAPRWWALPATILAVMLATVARTDWLRTAAVLVLGGTSLALLWAGRRGVAARLASVALPQDLLRRREHGQLEVVTDSEARALRSIGTTAYAVATRTGAILADLARLRGVRMFHGLRQPGVNLPCVPHAISVGRQLLLVESVAWPPGRYDMTRDGRIFCGPFYIGQSVAPLIATAERWRSALPKGHRVTAVIVVHRAAPGLLVLPAAPGGDAVWTLAENAAVEIRRRVVRGRPRVSRAAVAALIAASTDGPADALSSDRH